MEIARTVHALEPCRAEWLRCCLRPPACDAHHLSSAQALLVKRALGSSASAHALLGPSPSKAIPPRAMTPRMDAFTVERVSFANVPSPTRLLPVASARASSPPLDFLEEHGGPEARYRKMPAQKGMASLGSPSLHLKRGLLRVPHPPGPASRAGLSDISSIRNV